MRLAFADDIVRGVGELAELARREEGSLLTDVNRMVADPLETARGDDHAQAPLEVLRAELDHALTMAMVEDLSCTHFSYEVTTTPKARAAAELRDHFERWGTLPRYNEAGPAHHEGAVLRAGGSP